MLLCLALFVRCVALTLTMRGQNMAQAMMQFFQQPVGVLKFTFVVDNDTTVHDVRTYTVVFSPSVLIKCRTCPYHQTLTRTP